jgi:hypothetical protein
MSVVFVPKETPYCPNLDPNAEIGNMGFYPVPRFPKKGLAMGGGGV